jgi:hypothetical protein
VSEARTWEGCEDSWPSVSALAWDYRCRTFAEVPFSAKEGIPCSKASDRRPGTAEPSNSPSVPSDIAIGIGMGVVRIIRWHNYRWLFKRQARPGLCVTAHQARWAQARATMHDAFTQAATRSDGPQAGLRPGAVAFTLATTRSGWGSGRLGTGGPERLGFRQAGDRRAGSPLLPGSDQQ